MHSREINLLWSGKTAERMDVVVDVLPGGQTVVRYKKDGCQLHSNRAGHLYQSKAVAFAAVKATMEWLGYAK